MLCPDEELTKSEFYNDFLRHYGMFHQCGAVLGQEGSHTSAITLLRNKKAGPFGAGHVSLLRLLEPHLQSAIKVHFQVCQIRAQSQSAQWILDLLPKAVFFLDRRGKVIYMNQAAAQLVQDGDVLRLRNGELEASNPREARGLQVLLVGARNSEMLPGIQPGGMMWLTRTSLRSPVSVEVLPFLAVASPVPGSVSAVVFVTDLARKAPTNVATLRALWKLTEAEADLALKLLNGMTLKEAAGARQTTLSTARSQLKTILGKTGTSRQSDLIALLSRFCLLVPGS
jgi:DNA-binding CsgD family transcriptional regulator/PAS domain-containing protein